MRFHEETIASVSPKHALIFASYEDRCVTVARELRESGFDGDGTVFFCQDLPNERTNAHLREVESLLGDKTRKIGVSFRDPVSIIQAVSSLDLSGPLVVDVTCFNRGNLFPFLWASKLGREARPVVSFAHADPLSYGSWLARDYETPKNMLGFPGRAEFANDRILVCAVGYEAQRTLKIIEAAEPAKVVLLLGTRPTKQEFQERNRRAVEEVLGSGNYEMRDMDVSHPGVCTDNLRALLDELGHGAAVQFAPFSTKLSCLAIWAMWLADNSIRVWNAQPKTYNIPAYSRGTTAARYFRAQWNQ